MNFGKSVLDIIAQLGNEVMELKAENKKVKENSSKFLREDSSKIQELKAELSQLKADMKHDPKVCDDYDDDLIKECHELQSENESLQDQLKDAVNDYESLLNSNNVK